MNSWQVFMILPGVLPVVFKRVIDVVIVVVCGIVTISSYLGLESVWQTTMTAAIRRNV